MHWYVLSETTGMATLCASEADARREAKAYDRLYPRAAPHVATRLCACAGLIDRAPDRHAYRYMSKLGEAMNNLQRATDDDDYPVTQPEYDALRADKRRMDWLADPTNAIGNVQLPTRCLADNPHSLRAAIDAAMK